MEDQSDQKNRTGKGKAESHRGRGGLGNGGQDTNQKLRLGKIMSSLTKGRLTKVAKKGDERDTDKKYEVGQK